MAARRPDRTRSGHRRPWWTELDQDELLDTPLRRLRARIDGSALEGRVRRLEAELRRAGLRFRPYVWVSTEWFAPDGLTGFAVPFFLTHPRLARLERRYMLEVEGGNAAWCMKLLRHETAHALDNAYRLRRRKRWRELFGSVTKAYRSTYTPRPGSRRFVMNLDYWYSQSHPAEDFAETFAVWLQPRSGWRERYAGWPALEKIEYVDELMDEIGSRPAPVRTRQRIEPVSGLDTTLREYYRDKQARYGTDHPTEYDEWLRRVFTDDPFAARRERAGRFLSRHRSELRRRVSAVTGQHPYLVDQVLNDLILRCRMVDFRLARSERETRIDSAAMLTALTTSYLQRGHPEFHR